MLFKILKYKKNGWKHKMLKIIINFCTVLLKLLIYKTIKIKLIIMIFQKKTSKSSKYKQVKMKTKVKINKNYNITNNILKL